MNRQAFRHSRKAIGLTVAAGTALAGFGLTTTPTLAQSDSDNTQAASNGVSVSILSPFQSAAFEGAKKIEVSAFYQSLQGGGIQSIELDIDGVKAATKQLDNPEVKGIISFLVDPSTLASGNHKIAIRVVSSDSREATANTSFHYTGDAGVPSDGAIDTANPGAPTLAIDSLQQNQMVNGIVSIKVHVVDPSGKSPYVSLFVDNVFKTLRNYGPYTFDWDTSSVTNGPHTIEVSGFSDETQIGKSQTIHIIVNNVMGNTGIESIDDTPPTPVAQPAVPKPIKSRLVSPAPVVLPIPHNSLSAFPDTDGAPLAPQTDATLIEAHGNAAHRSASLPSELASANLQDSGIAMETILNAPFLAHKAPVTPDEITPKTSAEMIIPAMPSAPQFAHPAQKMASVQVDADDLSAQTLLAAPFLHPQSAPAPVQIPESSLGVRDVMPSTPSAGAVDNEKLLKPASRAASKQAKVNSAISAAPHIALGSRVEPVVSPVKIASAMVDSGLGSNDAAIPPAAAPEVATPMSAPQMAVPNVEIKLQTTTQHYQMASASIDSSIPSLGSLALKTPVMVPQTKPVAGRPMIDTSGIAHHTVDVFSSAVTERVRGSYVLVMDDHSVKLNQPMQERDKVLCAPLRQIFESEGGVLGWSAKDKTVHAMTADRDIQIKIGSRTAMVNGQATTLKTAPYIYKNRTMIPVGFLPIALNVSVSFDPMTGHVLINSKG